jgi:hypothetical protein
MPGDAPFPAPPEHRELNEAEQQELVTAAFDTHRLIKTGIVAVEKEMWALAEHVYRFHEGGMWGLLGHDTIDEWLADPEVTMKRTQFFRLSKMYRDLVVVRQVPIKKLEELQQSKVAEVVPAIMRGDVKVDDALADVKVLGARDLRIKYKGEKDPTGKPEVSTSSSGNGAGPEAAPDVQLPDSELKDEADAMVDRLLEALHDSIYLTFNAKWKKASEERRRAEAKKWLEAAAR